MSAEADVFSSAAAGECVNTFDEHEDKIWAMTVHGNRIVTGRYYFNFICKRAPTETSISGGADSLLHMWSDITEEENNQVPKIETPKYQRGTLLTLVSSGGGRGGGKSAPESGVGGLSAGGGLCSSGAAGSETAAPIQIAQAL